MTDEHECELHYESPDRWECPECHAVWERQVGCPPDWPADRLPPRSWWRTV